jgi:putative N6-adenine-specific DNA methylase
LLEAFAVAAPGLERIVANELRGLKAQRLRITDGGVEFRASNELIYAANLHLRAASRILVRLAAFHADSFPELERRARRVPWHNVVADGNRVRLRVTCRKSRLYHSDAVGQRVLDAITSLTGAVPDHKTPRGPLLPDDGTQSAQLFVVRIERDECTVSADTSGVHLHQRGYRQAVTQAPLRETLAAAMLLASGWDRKRCLIDPFCGSGTIPIEAAMMSREIAPGRQRRFRFMEWPDFDESLWSELHTRAVEQERKESSAPILGSDRSGWAMRAAAGNAARAHVAADVEFARLDISDLAPPSGSPGWVVTNPPYGVRLGAQDDLRRLYTAFGSVLRRRFPQWHVALLTADRRLDTRLRVALLERFHATNGGIPVRFVAGLVGKADAAQSSPD